MTQSPADVQATFCATLVDEWVHLGVRHAVISPGSRSTPMALALADRPELDVHVAHDERTAAFVALGIGVATGAPAALLCTSGTAATHFHAAVVEADLAGVPMLVLTADRPPELQGIGAPQTITQAHLYGSAVRSFVDAGVPDAGAADGWRSLAGGWWRLAVDSSNPGPVHVNLPFREPLVGSPGPLPHRVEPAHSVPVVDHDFDRARFVELLDVQRGVVIAGRGCGDPAAIGGLAEALGWPVLADPRSGCRGLAQAVCGFDSMLRHGEFAAAHAPHAVLHLGEPPASKVLGQWLQGNRQAPNVLVHRQPRVIDPLGVVTMRVVGDPTTSLGALRGMRGAAGTPWLARWQHADRQAQAALAAVLDLDAPLSEPGVARTLSTLPVQLLSSSSMPIRDLEWFGAPGAAATVHSNRGANGIDGVMATGIGIATATGRPTVVHLGDVAFCHDQSSLTALARRRLRLTIVVTDNDGGAIFSFLPQASTLGAERFEQLFGTPHGTDIVGVARGHGLGACTVVTGSELRSAVDDPAITVVRVATDRADNVRMHDRLHAAVAAALG